MREIFEIWVKRKIYVINSNIILPSCDHSPFQCTSVAFSIFNLYQLRVSLIKQIKKKKKKYSLERSTVARKYPVSLEISINVSATSNFILGLQWNETSIDRCGFHRNRRYTRYYSPYFYREAKKKERNRSRYDSELISRTLRNFCEISCDIFGRVDSFCFLFSSVVCLPNSEGSRGQCYAN